MKIYMDVIQRLNEDMRNFVKDTELIVFGLLEGLIAWPAVALAISLAMFEAGEQHENVILTIGAFLWVPISLPFSMYVASKDNLQEAES